MARLRVRGRNRLDCNSAMATRRSRDLIQDIAEVRGRRTAQFASEELSSRLHALQIAFGAIPSGEALRYFPVALVACMEAFFRSIIAELVDAGEPFLGNAEHLPAGIKVDFGILRALHGKAITVGELVAHSAPLSGLDHIDAVLSCLIGKNFLSALRTESDRWSREVLSRTEPLLANSDVVLGRVARTFELRHIICHEFATGLTLTVEETSQCLEACIAFLRGAGAYLLEVANPGAPLTQTGMNLAAAADLEDATARLNALIEMLTAEHGLEWRSAFDPVHATWQQFCDAWIAFCVGDRSAGGTIWPLQYAGIKTGITEHWIGVLSQYHAMEEGQFW